LFLEHRKKTIANQGNIAFLTILDDALYETDQSYN
jgi:hypothetical protein